MRQYFTLYFLFSRQFDKRNDNQSNNTFIQLTLALSLIIQEYIHIYIFFKKTCFSESIFNLSIYTSNINFYLFTKNTVESIFLIIALFSNWTRTFAISISTKFYLRIELSTRLFSIRLFSFVDIAKNHAWRDITFQINSCILTFSASTSFQL